MVSFDMSNLVAKFVVKYNVMGKYLTQEEVITRLTNTFGDKLDISKVKYIDAKTKVKVKCNVCRYPPRTPAPAGHPPAPDIYHWCCRTFCGRAGRRYRG